MKRLLTAWEMRRVDAAAGDHGMPASVLMENAGHALSQRAQELASADGRFLVLCGTGNNGGDGLVAARLLAQAGRTVHVELVGDATKLTGEPERNLAALRATRVEPRSIGGDVEVGKGDVVLDALFGTGLSRAPEGDLAQAIHRMDGWRAAGAVVLAADLPSGLQSDSGVPFAPCVHADVTQTFGFAKVGQAIEPGASRCGRLEVVDIGIPRAAHAVLADPCTWLLEEEDARSRLPRRPSDSHKGTFGHVLVVAGSEGRTGAASLTALAALRAGAGLVTVATRQGLLHQVTRHAPELMGHPLPGDGPLGPGDLEALLEALQGKSALVLGPGIHRGEDTALLLGALVQALSIPCVLDADGLNALGNTPELLAAARHEVLVTPHPGEMARLLGATTSDIAADRLGSARRLANASRAITVLKGARTVIALEDGTTFINPTGNPGMATAGSGDVLAGLLGALVGQGLSARDAAVTGVYAHGLAGDLAAETSGQLGLVASELISHLGRVWSRWGR